MDIVYYSNPMSNNTHRFVEKLGYMAHRLPHRRADPLPILTTPYILVFPTYGGGHEAGTVPQPVIRWLNVPENRPLLRGVVGAGNLNFGKHYAEGADIVSQKLQVPVIRRVEILGDQADVAAVQSHITTIQKVLS
jgi:protein involved in ribonucleotide reduction